MYGMHFMLWYGLSKTNNLGQQSLKNKFARDNRHQKLRLWSVSSKSQLNPIQLKFYVPRKWSFVVGTNKKLKLNLLYLYAGIYFFIVPVPSKFNLLQFDQNSSVLTLTSLYRNNFVFTYWTFFTQMFASLNRPFFLKVKFKGKGYYIYKNKRNTITPQFGYAHRIYKYVFYTGVKFRTKTSIILFGLLRKDLQTAGFSIKNMRSINIFTGRGVRFSRQVIYKKVGKVSSYR